MSTLTQRFLFGLVVASVVASAACGGRDPIAPSDAGGTDAPPREDAGPPVDLGPPPTRCVGTPTACASLPTDPECRTVMGCAFSQCAGFTAACMTNRNEADCTSELGCTWSGTACAGVPRSCGTFVENAACAAQAGCTWSTRAQCRGSATACAMLSEAACTSQPGCGIEIPDMGPPDLGPPDAGCMGGAVGNTTLAIHTVTWAMAGGTVGLGNVAVRAEGPCAAAPIEMNTDGAGNLSLALPNAGAPWSVTFARAGYAAISIMDVTNIGFDGDVQLDPIGNPTYVPYPASGTVTGSVGIGNTVQVDCYDFGTTTVRGGGIWSSDFDLAPPPNPAPPLVFVALELDGAGRAVNFAASSEQPRTGAPVSGVSIALPSPAAAAIETRILFHLPTTGIADGSGGTMTFDVHHARLDLAQDPFVLVGTSALEPGAPGDVTLVIRHFGGSLDANLAGLSVLGRSGLINVLVHDFVDSEVTIPAIAALQIDGGSLGALNAYGYGSGYDLLILHIGETDFEDPHWRVFADARSGAATIDAVPRLPTSVSLADIGIVGGGTQVVPLYVRMRTGRGWSAQGVNQASSKHAYAGGGQFTSVSTADL